MGNHHKQDAVESEADAAAPLSDASEAEINAKVDEVLRSGKHHTLPARGANDSTPASERLHARVIAAQMKRLAHRIRAAEPEVEESTADGPDDVDEWWFEVDEKRIGPISLRKVRFLWEDGELTPDSLCWHEGFSSWVSLFRVSELAEALAPRAAAISAPIATPPPVSPRSEGPISGSKWKPTAAVAMESANRLRLVATQKTAPVIDAAPEPAAIERPLPAPAEPAGTFATIPVLPVASAEKRRGGWGNALLSGLVAGLVIAAATFAMRVYLPQDPAQPVVVVVRDPAPTPAKPATAKPAPGVVAASPKPEPRPRPKLPATSPAPTVAPITRAALAAAPVEEKRAQSVDDAFAEQFKAGPDELESSEILEVVAAHRGAVDGCIRAYKSLAPEETGRLVMRWTVHKDGRVSDVSARTAELSGTTLASCLQKEIASWTFSKHEVAHAPVEFPFAF